MNDPDDEPSADSYQRLYEDLLEIQQVARAGSWTLDVATNKVIWSEELFVLFGMSPDQNPPSFTVQESYYTPDSWTRLTAAVDDLVTGRKAAYEIEIAIRRQDGTTGWLLTRGRSFPDDSGKVKTLRGVAIDISDRKKQERELQARSEELSRILMATSEMASAIGSLRDPYTHAHEQRVARLCKAMAETMGNGSQFIEGIDLAARLHDIGKVSIPADILSKPASLSPVEFELIKVHAANSYEILRKIPYTWPVAEVVWQHHERLDGSGYPRGLKEAEILPGAKIIAVADVVEAMVSHRPHRSAFPVEQALDEIDRGRDRLYDAEAVDTCIELFTQSGFEFPDVTFSI